MYVGSELAWDLNGTELPTYFDVLEVSFLVIYLIELLLRFYAHGLKYFVLKRGCARLFFTRKLSVGLEARENAMRVLASVSVEMMTTLKPNRNYECAIEYLVSPLAPIMSAYLLFVCGLNLDGYLTGNMASESRGPSQT